jgi:ATP-dependent helicase Lhr and Lhr-like helicase
VGDLDRVLQADAPDTVSSFLQRMGRTGRRDGQAANTTFFCESSESVLQATALIELAKQGWVEAVPVQDRCWPVLIHQLLTMALAGGGISQEEAWAHLSKVPDFAGISRPEFDRLIRWLLADGGLREASGQLVIGPKAEKRFGRKNFMELFAVFTSPVSYTVVTAAGQPLGSLAAGVRRSPGRWGEQLSCSAAEAGWCSASSTTTAGCSWIPPPAASSPPGVATSPSSSAWRCARRCATSCSPPQPSPTSMNRPLRVLEEKREAIQPLFQSGRAGIEVKDGELRWWTFAGGKINATLRYGLEAVGGDWKITTDNILVKAKGEGITPERFHDAIETAWPNPRSGTTPSSGRMSLSHCPTTG